jgi:hypothetical protein
MMKLSPQIRTLRSQKHIVCELQKTRLFRELATKPAPAGVSAQARCAACRTACMAARAADHGAALARRSTSSSRRALPELAHVSHTIAHHGEVALEADQEHSDALVAAQLPRIFNSCVTLWRPLVTTTSTDRPGRAARRRACAGTGRSAS